MKKDFSRVFHPLEDIRPTVSGIKSYIKRRNEKYDTITKQQELLR